MKLKKHGILLLLMVGCLAQVRAQESQCNTAEGKVLASLDELPAQILDLIGRSRTGIYGISDIGGKFNSSDAITDATVPMRRLVSGIVAPSCIGVVVEYGGVGHYQKNLEYRLTEGGWRQVAGAGLERAPRLAPVAAH